MTENLKLLSPTVGAPVTVNPATGKPPRWKMALDVDRCIGCHACSVACKVENSVPLGRYRTKVYYWKHGKFPQVKRNFLPTLCMQCEDAPCLKACPTDAIGCDANDAQSPYSRFMARHGAKTAVLKPEENTKPSVAYKGPTINDYPERSLFPLKRAGKRGEGKWTRITWDEAHAEIAKRIIRGRFDNGAKFVYFDVRLSWPRGSGRPDGRRQAKARVSHAVAQIRGVSPRHRGRCQTDRFYRRLSNGMYTRRGARSRKST